MTERIDEPEPDYVFDTLATKGVRAIYLNNNEEASDGED